MKLNVPETLKVLLVDDWEAVTKNNQVRPCSCLVFCTRAEHHTARGAPTKTEHDRRPRGLQAARPRPERLNTARLPRMLLHRYVADAPP